MNRRLRPVDCFATRLRVVITDEPFQLVLPLLLVTPHERAEEVSAPGVSNRRRFVPALSMAIEATNAPAAVVIPTPHDVEAVVQLLGAVYEANGRMASELDRLTASHASVSDAAVEALTRLADDLRPGAAARARLAAVDHDLQIAGAAEWIARRRALEPDVELLPTASGRAARRAAHRWARVPSSPGGMA